MDITAKDSTNLDLLRCCAVLIVVAYHIGQLFIPGDPFWAVGRAGVLIFFVHTALVLMFSLERLEKSRRPLLQTFYIQRAFRIYPLAIVCVLLIFALHLPADQFGRTLSWDLGNHKLRMLVSNLLLIQNLTGYSSISIPLWSLPFEVQMYVTLPFFFLIAKGRRSLAVLTALFALLTVTSALLYRIYGARHANDFPVTWFMPCFVAGVISFVLVSRYRPRLPSGWWPIVIAAVISGYAAWHPRGSEWLFCLALGLAIPQFRDLRRDSPVHRTSHAVAKYSYGLYLSHVPLLWICFHLVAAPLPCVAASLLP